MWEIVASIVQKYKVGVQAVLDDDDDDDPEDWSPWFLLPNKDYGEVKNYGPFSLKKLKILRIKPLETKIVGTRVPARIIDHTVSIENALKERQIQFERKGDLILIPAVD